MRPRPGGRIGSLGVWKILVFGRKPGTLPDSMKKAFLCYSSADKKYVEDVARKLGRARVVYAPITFEAGKDFRSEILRHLDQAAMFVFFASKKSLASEWCKFEIKEAEFRSVGGGIEGQLTLIIDSSVTHND